MPTPLNDERFGKYDNLFASERLRELLSKYVSVCL